MFYRNHVHRHIYKSYDASIRKTTKRIIRELSYFQIKKKQLKNKVILDFGSGYQALAFSKLGCKKIYHFDIEQSQINLIKKICKLKKINNIKSSRCDITKNFLPKKISFDIAFICGVFHHLGQPNNFFKNIIKRSSRESLIFFRMYNSGNFGRWLIYYLRQISTKIRINTFVNNYKKIILNNKKEKLNNEFFGNMLDDLFTPVIKMYNAKQFKVASSKLNISYISPRFQGTDFLSQNEDENFRFLLKRTKESYLGVRNYKFHDIHQPIYDKRYIINFEKKWKKFLDKIKMKDDFEKTKIIVLIYSLVRSKKFYDNTSKKTKLFLPLKLKKDNLKLILKNYGV